MPCHAERCAFFTAKEKCSFGLDDRCFLGTHLKIKFQIRFLKILAAEWTRVARLFLAQLTKTE
jgi:hypothetical protein